MKNIYGYLWRLNIKQVTTMKKKILILTFADHISDEQAKIITETHRNATSLYSDAELTEHEFTPEIEGFVKLECKPIMFDSKPQSESTPEPDAVAEMAKHFEPDVWEKIVKNYDPTFAVESGRDLKTACENESKPSEFLGDAFDWHESPEKYEYWDDIYESLKEKDL